MQCAAVTASLSETTKAEHPAPALVPFVDINCTIAWFLPLAGCWIE